MQVFAAWQPWPSALMYAVAACCGPGSSALEGPFASSAHRGHLQHSFHTAQGKAPAALLRGGMQNGVAVCTALKSLPALVSHEQ